MRVTIINVDNQVTIDGITLVIPLDGLDPSVHAVQWYGTYGEVEIKDPVTGKMQENRHIDSIQDYSMFVDAWTAKREELLAQEAIEAQAVQAAIDAYEAANTSSTETQNGA